MPAFAHPLRHVRQRGLRRRESQEHESQPIARAARHIFSRRICPRPAQVVSKATFLASLGEGTQVTCNVPIAGPVVRPEAQGA